jgi:hypothetical protein
MSRVNARAPSSQKCCIVTFRQTAMSSKTKKGKHAKSLVPSDWSEWDLNNEQTHYMRYRSGVDGKSSSHAQTHMTIRLTRPKENTSTNIGRTPPKLGQLKRSYPHHLIHGLRHTQASHAMFPRPMLPKAIRIKLSWRRHLEAMDLGMLLLALSL